MILIFPYPSSNRISSLMNWNRNWHSGNQIAPCIQIHEWIDESLPSRKTNDRLLKVLHSITDEAKEEPIHHRSREARRKKIDQFGKANTVNTDFPHFLNWTEAQTIDLFRWQLFQMDMCTHKQFKHRWVQMSAGLHVTSIDGVTVALKMHTSITALNWCILLRLPFL